MYMYECVRIYIYYIFIVHTVGWSTCTAIQFSGRRPIAGGFSKMFRCCLTLNPSEVQSHHCSDVMISCHLANSANPTENFMISAK